MIIAFDSFVTMLHTQLTKRYPGRNITLESVQCILTQAQIPQILQPEEQQQQTLPSNKLQLRRLRIKGQKFHTDRREKTPFCYDRSLQSGINGWIAGNGTGKSTLLKAIVWGLTGIEQHFKQDIQSWIEDVASLLPSFRATKSDRLHHVRRSGYHIA
jgi:AAA domain